MWFQHSMSTAFIFSLEKCHSSPFALFKLESLFLLLNVKVVYVVSALNPYIIYIKIWNVNIFSCPIGVILHLWLCRLVCVCVCVCTLLLFSCVWLFATPWTIVFQAPLSMEFSRQGYWSGLPFPPTGIFLTHRSNPCFLHWQADSLPLSHLGSTSPAPSTTLTYILHGNLTSKIYVSVYVVTSW